MRAVAQTRHGDRRHQPAVATRSLGDVDDREEVWLLLVGGRGPEVEVDSAAVGAARLRFGTRTIADRQADEAARGKLIIAANNTASRSGRVAGLGLRSWVLGLGAWGLGLRTPTLGHWIVSGLPSAFCLLPSAFCLLPSAFCLLPSAFCLLPSAFCLLPSAFCLLPSAFCLLPSAFCLLPSAFCLLRHAQRLPIRHPVSIRRASANSRRPHGLSSGLDRISAPRAAISW